jgi:hypothetical protein
MSDGQGAARYSLSSAISALVAAAASFHGEQSLARSGREATAGEGIVLEKVSLLSTRCQVGVRPQAADLSRP